MAPLDPSTTARPNTLPVATFAGQALLVAGLTANIVQTIRRAAHSLPPASATRAQGPVRRRKVAIFSVLALLSLASVTTFTVAWRVLSYFEWAERGKHEAPGTIWTGWYGTGEEGVGGWRLGDWWSDVDLFEDSDATVLAAPEAFLYMYQYFCGMTAAAIFYGVEGRRRNLPTTTIASFVLLSAVGSLGYALNLFFVAMLFTPLALHDDDTPRHDALFTPKPAVLYVPVVASILVQQYLPSYLARRKDTTPIRVAYFVVPMFLAFAPKIVGPSLGRHHASKASAHRSFVRAFYVLGVTSLLLHWKTFFTSVFVNTPPPQNSVYDLFKNAIGKQDNSNRLLTGLGNTAQRLKVVSTHPAISVTANDVAFTALGLLVWAFIRQLDVSDILDNSILSFLSPSKAEKHVSFKDKVEEAVEHVEEEAHPATTPKKRGRPKKHTVNGADFTPSMSASSAASLRRSTRLRTTNPYNESDAEDSYEPTSRISRAVKQTEADGASTAEDMVAGGESTALALLLAFTGGLGQLAASVLGAEVTGSA